MKDALDTVGVLALIVWFLGFVSGAASMTILLASSCVGILAFATSSILGRRQRQMARKNSTPQIDPAEAALAPQLFVKFEVDQNDDEDGGYLLADKELDTLVERDTTVVGVYKLQEIKRYKLDVHEISPVTASTAQAN